jgi:hypothetical protein
MVQLAERKSIRNDRVAKLICIRRDVSSVEELRVSQAAQRTGLAIGPKDSLAEGGLKESSLGSRSDVRTPRLRIFGCLDDAGRRHQLSCADIVDLEVEEERRRIVSNDENWVRCGVASLAKPKEVSERRAKLASPS